MSRLLCRALYTADVNIGVSGDHATTDWPKGVTRKMHPEVRPAEDYIAKVWAKDSSRVDSLARDVPHY